ncbi:hypothetical protein DPMN_061835 [Dreissena polymorpha]|uniref:Uncharacterized protein n=1 Tax=Dreissena polymorpha TaxID=45954 RepID=A0A9D4C7Q8_DREPO|nr:hypothetical protein DPMN_061835 [Dreissena polymorpha]
MTVKDSMDVMVHRTFVETRTGRKWSASQTVPQTESRLRHKDIVGTTVVGTQDLGSAESRSWKKADSRTRREMDGPGRGASGRRRRSMYKGSGNWVPGCLDEGKEDNLGGYLAQRTSTH